MLEQSLKASLAEVHKGNNAKKALCGFSGPSQRKCLKIEASPCALA